MAFHLKRNSILKSAVGTVYYTGNRQWSNLFSERKQYDTKSEVEALMVNTDGKNGGWTGSLIVEE